MPDPRPDQRERHAALALSLAIGIGSATFTELIARFGSAEQALSQRSDREALLQNAAVLEARTAASGAALLVLGDAEYPTAFADLEAPPMWTTSIGELRHLGPVGVAIVGTRQATPYGTRIAREVASAVVRAGGVVVSGLARGIDAVAHRAALEAGGATVAVLGTGVDVAYPANHRALHADVAERGLLISEFAPGASASPGSFPRRNRLIAALARVTLVVEAGHRSGALITASQADAIGRDVFAVPGPVDATQSAGCNRLIRDGAQIMTEIADVLQAAGLMVPLASSRADALVGAPRAVWDALGRGPLDADALAAASRLPARACLATITELELAGLVECALTGEIRRRGW